MVVLHVPVGLGSRHNSAVRGSSWCYGPCVAGSHNVPSYFSCSPSCMEIQLDKSSRVTLEWGVLSTVCWWHLAAFLALTWVRLGYASAELVSWLCMQTNKLTLKPTKVRSIAKKWFTISPVIQWSYSSYDLLPWTTGFHPLCMGLFLTLTRNLTGIELSQDIVKEWGCLFASEFSLKCCWSQNLE